MALLRKTSRLRVTLQTNHLLKRRSVNGQEVVVSLMLRRKWKMEVECTRTPAIHRQVQVELKSRNFCKFMSQ